MVEKPGSIDPSPATYPRHPNRDPVPNTLNDALADHVCGCQGLLSACGITVKVAIERPGLGLPRCARACFRWSGSVDPSPLVRRQDAITHTGANDSVEHVEEDRGKDDVEDQTSDVSHDQRLPSRGLDLTATGAKRVDPVPVSHRLSRDTTKQCEASSKVSLTAPICSLQRQVGS